MSNDETGLVFVGLTVFFALLGYLLSRAGLEKVDTAAREVRAGAVADQIDKVNDALAGLTGNQAPARVAWAFCALCLVGAFLSFDLISLSVSPDADATGS